MKKYFPLVFISAFNTKQMYKISTKKFLHKHLRHREMSSLISLVAFYNQAFVNK